jgi:hypothetical protein
MCCIPKRNCLLRLLRSIVSRSTMWISPNPVRTKFLRSSHPIPPAPTMRTRAYLPYFALVGFYSIFTDCSLERKQETIRRLPSCSVRTSLILPCSEPSDFRGFVSRPITAWIDGTRTGLFLSHPFRDEWWCCGVRGGDGVDRSGQDSTPS